MLHKNINVNGNSTFIYKQIYTEFKNNILEEKMKFNERLPSKRKLAEQLKVSINSVSNAYEQLAAEGYIYTVERKGYFVENITQFTGDKAKVKKSFPSDLKEKPFNNEGWLSLSHMSSDSEMFPFKEWLKNQKKAISNHTNELAEISDPQGPYIVRKTISNMIGLTRGVVCEPEQIVIGAGTQPLISQLMQTRKSNTEIAIENPGYSRIYTLLKASKFTVHPIELDEKGINIKEIERSNPNFIYITPSHQFPTGIIMPITRRIELLNWAGKSKNRYIIEDDYDSEFKYGTDNIPSLQSLDRNQKVIYCGTFSKSLLPSFRISYIVLPPNILKEYRKRYATWIQGSNTLDLLTLHYFMDSGEYTKHIKRMNHHYEIKRKNLIELLSLKFKEAITIKDMPAGLHFLAEFKTEKSYEDIEKEAKLAKIEIYSLKRFMLKDFGGEKNKVSLVLGFAKIKNKDISKAVDILHRIIT